MNGLLLRALLQSLLTMTAMSLIPPANAAAHGDAAPTINPLLAPWRGPYGGVPPFDKVRVADLKPALLAAMAEETTEDERIATNPAAPTFDNTLAALEMSGRMLDRVSRIFRVYTSTLNGKDVQAIATETAPLLAAHFDRITQNEKLFKRIAAVYAARATSRLSAEQQRLAWLYYTNFVRAGAQLDPGSKTRLSELNQQLASLYTKFSQNLLADENDHWLELNSDEDFAGLPEAGQQALSAAAASRGIKARGAVLNTRSSVEPFLENSTRRDLRETVWRTFVSRGDNGDAHDNNATVTQILRLRAERARLLGFPSHAHWRLENSMAKTPERALRLMDVVWPAAVARAREEIADMQAMADREGAAPGGGRITIEPWDYRFYAERVRKAKYDLDFNEVKPYLQLEKLREGMFWVAGRLFGFKFSPLPAGRVPVAHPDIRVFEVTDANGRHVGLWYFDPYARQYKESGAWMSEYRSEQRLDGRVTAIVSNNTNFVRGRPGQPILISWGDATGLFHEFGHALHGLSSTVTYPSLAGTAVPRDYVEFPSQLLEHWLATPEVLGRFALHYQTGKPIPEELIAKIRRTETFNQGFTTVEYLAAALVDMRLHLAGDQPIDPHAFERDTLASLGMPHEIVMRHRIPQFHHVFAGDGYSAAYYSYLWADTLSEDAWEAFTEAGGPYDPAVAARLRDNVFSVGNTRDPAEAYRAFRGRDPGVAALMRRRGFPVPATADAAQSDP
ncbi:MAG TPA: M3 family metallopeptidase [Steroidobacteraceae bacterium]|nr:M3 family metallopeptidase [Steroidobacteraceae bacterium]